MSKKEKKEEVEEAEIEVPQKTEEEIEKLDDVEERAVSVKLYRGLILRLFPSWANIKRWMNNFVIKFFGLDKSGYVRFRMIDPNFIEKEFVIPYRELVKYKKEMYYLSKKYRTTGAFNLATFTFYQGLSAPINMTKPTNLMDASWFTKLLEKAKLDADLGKKAVTGGNIFGGIGQKGVILIVLVISFIIYYFAYGKQFLPIPGT